MKPSKSILISILIYISTFLAFNIPLKALAAYINSVSLSCASGPCTSGATNFSGANFLVCGLVGRSDSGYVPDVITSSPSNTWTTLGIENNTVLQTQIVYAKNASVSSSQTITLSTADTMLSATSCAGFSGMNTSAPYDTGSDKGNHATDPSKPGATTPSAANAILFTTVGSVTGIVTFGIDSGNIIGTQPNGAYSEASAYLTQTSATSYDPSWTGAGAKASRVAAFLSATGAAYTTTSQRTLLGAGHP